MHMHMFTNFLLRAATRRRLPRLRNAPSAGMLGSPSKVAAKFTPRPAVPKNAADALKERAKAVLNVDDEPLAVEYANGEQGQVDTRDWKVATGATAKVMEAANVKGGSFKIPKTKKPNVQKLEVVGGTPSPRAHQPRCAASPALLASHARIAPC